MSCFAKRFTAEKMKILDSFPPATSREIRISIQLFLHGLYLSDNLISMLETVWIACFKTVRLMLDCGLRQQRCTSVMRVAYMRFSLFFFLRKRILTWHQRGDLWIVHQKVRLGKAVRWFCLKCPSGAALIMSYTRNAGHFPDSGLESCNIKKKIAAYFNNEKKEKERDWKRACCIHLHLFSSNVYGDDDFSNATQREDVKL